MSNRLYVGGLPTNADEDELKQLFIQAGEVISCRVVRDRDSSQSRGFAFIEMGSEAEAQQAISRFNGFKLDGHSLSVSEARDRRDRGADRH